MVVVLVLSGVFLYVVAMNMLVPQSLKLTDCTNATMHVQLTVPKGRNYYLVLVLPGTEIGLTPSVKFAGNVRLTERGQTQASSFTISSDLVQTCNWLEQKGFGWSYALTGFRNTNCLRLDSILKPQKTYDVEITFAPPLSPSNSIWLHWIQAVKDKGK